jgi:hypothetical protein
MLAVNNNANLTGVVVCRLQGGSTTVNCYTNLYNGAWANSLAKGIAIDFWYEAEN